MKNDYDILLIDPPMSYFKKEDNDIISLWEIQETPYIAFNPGLLSIGSYLKHRNYTVKLKHIKQDANIEKDLHEVAKWGRPTVIGVSCSYFQTYDNSLRICEVVTRMFPESIIIMGGQHAGNIPGYVLTDSKNIDFVCMGEGEKTIENLLCFFNSKNTCLGNIGGIAFGERFLNRGYNVKMEYYKPCNIVDFINDCQNCEKILDNVFCSINLAEVIDLDSVPFLYYDLYDDYLTYPCYIEESRGCYAQCNYCVAPIYGNYRYKSAEKFLNELDRAIQIYGFENNYPFLASNFGVNVDNTVKIFNEILKKYQGKLIWSAEFRADLEWEQYIDLMYKAGCRGFNIGMDSPCSSVLNRMNKTKKANYYLEKVDRLINAIAKYPDAAICINMMFYPGETAETLMDSIRFISKYYEKIAAVHYSPTNLYYGTKAWNNFNDLNFQYGTRLVKTKYFDRVHVYPLHPSETFNNDEANYWCRIIEKLFSEKNLFAQYHETRLTRDENGHLSQDDRKFAHKIYDKGE